MSTSANSTIDSSSFSALELSSSDKYRVSSRKVERRGEVVGEWADISFEGMAKG